jgi:hypothetical protein
MLVRKSTGRDIGRDQTPAANETGRNLAEERDSLRRGSDEMRNQDRRGGMKLRCSIETGNEPLMKFAPVHETRRFDALAADREHGPGGIDGDETPARKALGQRKHFSAGARTNDEHPCIRRQIFKRKRRQQMQGFAQRSKTREALVVASCALFVEMVYGQIFGHE